MVGNSSSLRLESMSQATEPVIRSLPGIDLSIAYPMLVTGYEALIVQWNEKWPARFDDVTSPQSATKGLTNVHISNYRWRFRHAVFGSGNDWD
jgi:hypothetical protein